MTQTPRPIRANSISLKADWRVSGLSDASDESMMPKDANLSGVKTSARPARHIARKRKTERRLINESTSFQWERLIPYATNQVFLRLRGAIFLVINRNRICECPVTYRAEGDRIGRFYSLIYLRFIFAPGVP
jgi:hypothetical protein